jgi:hypothetical protein
MLLILRSTRNLTWVLVAGLLVLGIGCTGAVAEQPTPPPATTAPSLSQEEAIGIVQMYLAGRTVPGDPDTDCLTYHHTHSRDEWFAAGAYSMWVVEHLLLGPSYPHKWTVFSSGVVYQHHTGTC